MAAAPQAPQEPSEAPELSKDVSKDVAQPLAQPLAHGFENLEYPITSMTPMCRGWTFQTAWACLEIWHPPILWQFSMVNLRFEWICMV